MNLPENEQETIVTRMRSDKNELEVYSSDTRVMRKLIREFPDCKKIYNKHYEGVFPEHPNMIALSVTTDTKITRRGSLLFPISKATIQNGSVDSSTEQIEEL